MSKSKISIRLLVTFALIALAAGIYFQQSQKPDNDLPALTKAVILPNSKTLNHVDFIDHNGDAFTKEKLTGYWNILFFGFTNCPDICPTTMRTLQQVKAQLNQQKKWGNYRVIMVSVDPQRDTQERLKNYVPYFDEEFIGLRSDEQTTTEFAKQMGILFVKQKADDDFYQVDHSASLILVNPQGEMAGVITAPHKEDEISQDLLLLADYFAADHAQPPMTQMNHAHAEHGSNESQHAHADMGHSASHNMHSASNNDETINGLTISNSWIRPAPPSANSMAGYLTFQNQSESDITLVAAQSPNFGMVMMHDTVIENDIAKMLHLDKLTIPANSEVVFSPLGKHLMLMHAREPLNLGESASITLIDENGAQLTHRIEVKQP